MKNQRIRPEQTEEKQSSYPVSFAIVLHDDAKREYAYGPAQGLPDTKVGTFTHALYNEARKRSRTVLSMKNGWKRIFAFEQ
jgi:hypothetical protein